MPWLPDGLSENVQGVIGPGGVQWMTAGRGIVHSEMPKVTEGDLWGFQLWINLPAQDKMVKPRYACPSSCAQICVLATHLPEIVMSCG